MALRDAASGEAYHSSSNRLSDFISLPLVLSLPSTKAAKSTPPLIHYIYLRPHEPRGDEVLTKPALFVSNLPVDATESAVKSLFNTLCAGRGRVLKTVLQSTTKSINGFGSIRDRSLAEEGDSDNDGGDSDMGPAAARTKRKHIGLVDNSVAAVAAGAPKAKKSKRIVASAQAEEEKLLEKLEATPLPSVWKGVSQLLPSGSCAVVYFVDKASLQSCLKACRRAAKTKGKTDSASGVVWTSPSDFLTGRDRYTTHNRLIYPSPQEIRQSVNSYLTTFATLEKHRQTVQEQLANQPDEDGFITVTKATRFGVSSSEAEAARGREMQRKEKTKVSNTFYRFQVREMLREKDRKLREDFAADVQRLRELQAQKKA